MASDQDPDIPVTIEINRDVDCEIYAVKYSRLAGAPASRLQVTLTFDGVFHARLAAILGANLKGQATVHFVNVQAPLPDEPEDDDPKPSAQAPLAAVEPVDKKTANRGREVKTRAVSGNGEAVLAHKFRPDEQDGTLCMYCRQGSGAEIHAAHSGLPDTPEGEMAAGMIEEVRREVPEEQRLEAEAALAARAST